MPPVAPDPKVAALRIHSTLATGAGNGGTHPAPLNHVPPGRDQPMNESRTTSNFFIAGMRWLARFSALAMAGLILLVAVGEGFYPTKLRLPEVILFVPLFLAWLGLWLGWRWEGLGGALIVVGMTGFYLTHFALTGLGRFPRGWAFPAIAVPGLRFLLCWFLRRNGLGWSTGQLQHKVSCRRTAGKV